MELVRAVYCERLSEIESYYEFISQIDTSMLNGGAIISSRFNRNFEYKISPTQQKILYSSVYLMLYNLVESTMSKLIDAVERHVNATISGKVTTLTRHMRDIYINSVTEPSKLLSHEEKMNKAKMLFDQILGFQEAWVTVDKGGGGNWGCLEIDSFNKKIGLRADISPEIKRRLMAKRKNDMSSLELIRYIRNKLAHGELSFSDCGAEDYASEFRCLIDIIKDFFNGILSSYERYIDKKEFIEHSS